MKIKVHSDDQLTFSMARMGFQHSGRIIGFPHSINAISQFIIKHITSHKLNYLIDGLTQTFYDLQRKCLKIRSYQNLTKRKSAFYLRIIIGLEICPKISAQFIYMFNQAPQPFGQSAGGLFGNSQSQPQGGLFGNTTQNSTPFSNQPQGGTGIFGGNQQAPAPQGGIFGMNQGNTAPTNNVFGGSNVQQGTPFGNNSGNGLFGNAQNSNQTGMFGNNPSQGAGIFGNSQPQNQPNSGIFNTGASNQFKQNTPMFGGGNTTTAQGIFGGQNNTQGNSVFGGANNQNQGGGVFGGLSNNNNNNKGIFGGGNNNVPSVFGSSNANTGSVFGGGNSTTPFGNAQGPSVLGGATNQGGGIFGNSNPGFQGNTGGVFGNTQQGGVFPNNNNNSVFGNSQGVSVFGNTQNNNQGMGVFGNTQNNNQSAPFGQANQGGIFNAANKSVFGATSTAPQTGFAFGNNNTTFGAQTTPSFGGANNQSSFGNTSWGVPTGGNTQAPKFTPLKPKNPKIDNKHMIKCITLLDENMNFCKNQLRIRYIMTGGSSQPRNQTVGFGQPAAGTQAPLFGSNPTGTPATSFGGGVFGQNPQPAAGGGLFGNTSPGGNGLFGGSNTANTGGQLFGGGVAGMPQSNTGFNMGGNTGNTQGGGFGLFGNTNNTSNSAFKPQGGGLFGSSNPAPQATGGLFGSSVPNNTGAGGLSFLNNQSQPQQPSGGLFGNTNAGMFGNQGATQPGGGLFGSSTTPSMQQPQGSMFGGGGSLFGNTNSQPSAFNFGQGQSAGGGGLFGQSQPQTSSWNQAGLFGSAPQNGNVTQFATSFINGLFNSDFFKKLITRDSDTPYDELKKEAVKKYSNATLTDALKKVDQPQQQPLTYIPRYNKYHKSMYGSTINFHQSPYLTNQFDYDSPSYNDSNSARPFWDLGKFKTSERFEYTKDHNPIIVADEKPKFKQEIKAVPTRRKYPITDELPVLGDYSITPTLNELKNKSPEELKKVSNVTIQNQFGKIKFRNPISLFKKKVEDCIKIKENSIDIVDQEWEKARCELFFYNFGGYSSLASAEEKTKLEKKIKKWVEKNKMREKSFDKQTGELHVEIH